MGDVILTQDIKSKASEASENPWISSYATGIFFQGHIFYVMVAIFYSPMATDCPRKMLRFPAPKARTIISDFFRRVPTLFSGIKALGDATDPNDAFDRFIPLNYQEQGQR
jgi:hypothetical protein